MKFNIFIKFLMVVLFVAAIVGSGSVYVFSTQQRRVTEDIYIGFATSMAKSLDASVSESDLKNPEELKSRLYKLLLLNPDILAVTINLEKEGGLVQLLSTRNDKFDGGEIHTDEDQNRQAFKTNQNYYHNEVYNGVSALSVIVPLHLSGNVVGTYNIVVSLQSLDESSKNQTRSIFLLAALTLFSLIVVVSLLVKLLISDPLSRLVIATKSMEEGNFDIKVKNVGNDEIGNLSRAYEKMAQKLKYSYSDLERRVEAATRSEKQKLLISENLYHELKGRTKQIEEQNITLNQNKQAMINLLEDSKALEEALKKEKESVEKKVVERTSELSSEKSKLAASIEALAKAFVMIDLNANIILTNENLNKIFNENKKTWKVEEVQAKFGNNFDFIKAYQKVLIDKQRVNYDDIIVGSRYFQVRLSPVFDGDEGNRVVTGILAIIGDVTEEKILERSKDEFFSIASHELRTPLTAIRGNTSMILDYYKDAIKDPELKLMITDMHDASLRLIGIVNDFLDLSRLEQGKMEYKLTSTKLKDIITNVVNELEATAKEKKIKLEANIPDDVVVNVDSDKIKQVLFNIAGNSIKFTEKGGVTITSEVKDNFAIVRITDTGMGIPLANQALLFHKFQQAASSTITRDGAKGTGLGLYISKLMVEGMGGKIGLESSVEGKGSVFVFTLPIAKS